MTTPGVDFFRIDRSGPTRRLLVIGVLMVTSGATAVGAHLVRRLPLDISHVVSLVGGVCMIAGLVLAFGALAMMLFEDVYLSIRDDGLLVHENGTDTTIAWDELSRVVLAPKGFVELHRDAREPVRWFAGAAAKTVAARIEEAKRKAAHGLLRTGSSAPPPASPSATS